MKSNDVQIWRTFIFYIKKHLFIPVLLLAVYTIWFICSNVFAQAENSELSIQHRRGDAAELKPITVTGKLVDGYHSAGFIWHENNLVQETVIFKEAAPNRFTRSTTRNTQYRFEGQEFSIHANQYFAEYTIIKQRLHGQGYYSGSTENATITLPIQAATDYANYFNQISYGLTAINDDVYFTVPVSTTHEGINGIYKVSFAATDRISEQQSVSFPITSFTLPGKDAPQEEQLAIAGLDATGDKLLLLVTQNNQLIINSFAANGSFLGKSVVPNIQLISTSEQLAEAIASNAKAYYANYSTYRNNEQISFVFSSIENFGDKLIVTIDNNQPDNLASVMRIHPESEQLAYSENDSATLQDIRFVDGKLYVLSTFLDNGPDYVYLTDPLKSIRLVLQAYSNHSKIYEGELITNMNDDKIQLIQEDAARVEFHERRHRRFEELAIQPAALAQQNKSSYSSSGIKDAARLQGR